APSTPPPPRRVVLAALTIASVSCSVMSPSISSMTVSRSTARAKSLLIETPLSKNTSQAEQRDGAGGQQGQRAGLGHRGRQQVGARLPARGPAEGGDLARVVDAGRVGERHARARRQQAVQIDHRAVAVEEGAFRELAVERPADDLAE